MIYANGIVHLSECVVIDGPTIEMKIIIIINKNEAGKSAEQWEIGKGTTTTQW